MPIIKPRGLLPVLALHMGIALGYAGLLIRAALDGLLWRADFAAFYTGGTIVRQGLGPHLYDLNLQTRVQQAIRGSGRMFYAGVLPCPPAGERDLGGGLAGTGGGETPGRILPRAGHPGGTPLAGADPLAVDLMEAQTMGFGAEEVEHLAVGTWAGLGQGFHIEVRGTPLEALRRRYHRLPDKG